MRLAELLLEKIHTTDAVSDFQSWHKMSAVAIGELLTQARYERDNPEVYEVWKCPTEGCDAFTTLTAHEASQVGVPYCPECDDSCIEMEVYDGTPPPKATIPD